MTERLLFHFTAASLVLWYGLIAQPTQPIRVICKKPAYLSFLPARLQPEIDRIWLPQQTAPSPPFHKTPFPETLPGPSQSSILLPETPSLLEPLSLLDPETPLLLRTSLFPPIRTSSSYRNTTSPVPLSPSSLQETIFHNSLSLPLQKTPDRFATPVPDFLSSSTQSTSSPSPDFLNPPLIRESPSLVLTSPSYSRLNLSPSEISTSHSWSPIFRTTLAYTSFPSPESTSPVTTSSSLLRGSLARLEKPLPNSENSSSRGAHVNPPTPSLAPSTSFTIQRATTYFPVGSSSFQDTHSFHPSSPPVRELPADVESPYSLTMTPSIFLSTPRPLYETRFPQPSHAPLLKPATSYLPQTSTTLPETDPFFPRVYLFPEISVPLSERPRSFHETPHLIPETSPAPAETPSPLSQSLYTSYETPHPVSETALPFPETRDSVPETPFSTYEARHPLLVTSSPDYDFFSKTPPLTPTTLGPLPETPSSAYETRYAFHETPPHSPKARYPLPETTAHSSETRYPLPETRSPHYKTSLAFPESTSSRTTPPSVLETSTTTLPESPKYTTPLPSPVVNLYPQNGYGDELILPPDLQANSAEQIMTTTKSTAMSTAWTTAEPPVITCQQQWEQTRALLRLLTPEEREQLWPSRKESSGEGSTNTRPTRPSPISNTANYYRGVGWIRNRCPNLTIIWNLPQVVQQRIMRIWSRSDPSATCDQLQRKTKQILLNLPPYLRRFIRPPQYACQLPHFYQRLEPSLREQLKAIWQGYIPGTRCSERVKSQLQLLAENDISVESFNRPSFFSYQDVDIRSTPSQMTRSVAIPRTGTRTVVSSITVGRKAPVTLRKTVTGTVTVARKVTGSNAETRVVAGSFAANRMVANPNAATRSATNPKAATRLVAIPYASIRSVANPNTAARTVAGPFTVVRAVTGPDSRTQTYGRQTVAVAVSRKLRKTRSSSLI